MSRIKKLIPRLPDTPDVLKAREFVETNFADKAMITHGDKTYLRAYIELDNDIRELAVTLVQVLHCDFRYDTVSFRPASNRITIEWDPRRR
jgi:hypothetical protein